MKKVVIFVLIHFLTKEIFSQDINFSWAKQLARRTGSAADESYFIATDGAGNVYVAGNFKNTIDLDPGPGVYNVTNLSDNIFICKLDPQGKFIWGRQLGRGQATAICKALSVDLSGNVYTTGFFSGKADFDPGQAEYNLISSVDNTVENKDIFISKLDANGNFQWAKQIGGAGIDVGNSINTDGFGNIYTTGYFTGVVNFDAGAVSLKRGSSGAVTAFITKMDAAGNLKYANVFETDHNSATEFIRSDNKGNVYVTGHFNGTIDFDPGPAQVSFTTTYNSQNTFLAKFDSLGNFIWVKQDIMGYDIAVDNDGNIYIYDEQLTKYDSNGDPIWTKLVGGTPYSSYQHNDISVDGAGNIYLTGLFRYTRDFDPGTGVYNITTSGGGFESDVFVCRLSSNGDLVWVKTFGSTGEDYATSLAIDNSGNVYTTGIFNGTVDFDPGPAVYNLAAPPEGGTFIHKMSPCNNKASSELNVTSCKRYTLNNITYDSSGTYTQAITRSGGCDSIITLNLKIEVNSTNSFVATCDNYVWHGRLLTKSGKYGDTLQTINGCDSIVNLDLTINQKQASFVNAQICKGQAYLGHTTPGNYVDTFHTANSCDSLVTIHLTILDKPAPDLGGDTELCPGDSLKLLPGTFQSYLWQDNSSQMDYLVKKAGLYSVTVTNVCGTGYGEILIKEKNCKIYFPNAFTPNNDGKNDKFIILNSSRLTSYHLSVYNRWGEKVFETRDYLTGWYGTCKGGLANEGTYVWYCSFMEAGVARNMKGTVVLLR